jgi:hypothetical protein
MSDITEYHERLKDKPYDQLANIIAYEQGELDEKSTIALFQSLVDTGLAWKLQGSYSRTAKSLIEGGYIK